MPISIGAGDKEVVGAEPGEEGAGDMADNIDDGDIANPGDIADAGDIAGAGETAGAGEVAGATAAGTVGPWLGMKGVPPTKLNKDPAPDGMAGFINLSEERGPTRPIMPCKWGVHCLTQRYKLQQ